MTPLDIAFRRLSPRLNPRPVAPLGALIAAIVALVFGAAMTAALVGGGLLAWSVGVAFILYDIAHMCFVGWQARKLFPPPAAPVEGPPVRLAVMIAAYNEAAAIPATLAALFAQASPPDQILIADDGSTDATAELLAASYGFAPPSVDGLAQSPVAPSLFWLRLAHRGKARALNAALAHVDAEVVLTVDADTFAAPDALAEVRRAFAGDPELICAGGVLEPRCRGGAGAAVLQTFQRFEYVRNFLARFAWTQAEALVLVSGAFAGFRTQALREVGGFDPECLVEDYELIHRLHRRARDAGGIAKIRILGRAFATTDAPATVPAFLRQRRRWFAGFLQTHYWNRDMVGAPRYGSVGLAMLPVKSLDAAAPIYGLAAFAVLVGLVFTGRFGAVYPASGLALAKLALDLANMTYSLEAYRRWTGGRTPRRLALALVCLIAEPFTFQPLRQFGAARGWVALFRGRLEWERAPRQAVPLAPREEGTPSA